MSVITKDNNFSSNNKDEAGYFRIGFVTLDIPPENILTQRVVNNEKITPLRGVNEMFQKTGQARWDVTVSWIAMLNDASETERFQQWEDLQNVVAIFKAAPFVEVESPHLRQLLAATDPAFNRMRMSMGLRQLRIDTHQDITDGLNVTLTMTYFNSLPYSQDFAYQDDSGAGADAYKSTKFKQYISAWRRSNMDHASRYPGDPACPPWLTQNAGEMAIKWRSYLPVLTGQTPDYAGELNAPTTIGGTVVPTTVTPRTSRGHVSLDPDIAQIVIQAAKNVGFDPGIAQAVCWYESRGNANAVSATGAKGLFQLLDSTAHGLGVTNSLDPVQNAAGGIRYLQQMVNKFGSYELALAAYNAGPAYVICYRDGKSQVLKNGTIINPNKDVTGGIPPAGVPLNENCPKYIATVLGVAQSAFGYNGAAVPPAVASATPAAPATRAKTHAGSKSNPVTVTNSDTERAFQGRVKELCDQGWTVDHRADPAGVGVLFLYKENEIRVAPQDSDSEGLQPGLFTTQFSVIFVNNLAQIPLAGFQYPTYQHIGPCSSMVQVSFVSKGDTNFPGTSEPIHEGLINLTSMAHNMEQQYHRLRTQFRSVYSVHRMQAVYVENQVLNMLGVYGLMLDQVGTQTVAESSDLVTASLTASQYENKFEELTPYKVNAIENAYMGALKDAMKGDALAKAATQASPDERSTMGAAFTYSQQAGGSDENDMNKRLLAVARQTVTDPPFFSFLADSQTFSIPAANASALANIVTSNAGDYPVAAARVKQLQQSGMANTWTMGDYLMFKSVAYDTKNQLFSGSGNTSDIVAGIDGSLILHGVPRQSLVTGLYWDLFPYFATNDTALRNALNQVMQSPTLGASIKNSVSSSDPALANSDHGAYRDMGLNSLVLNGEDFNPGMYFVDEKAQYRNKTQSALQNIAAQTKAGSDYLARPTQSADGTVPQIPGGAIPLTNTTSIPGNMDSIMKSVHIPGYSMTEAFPTFKLFFMEDAGSGIYYAFDNFYSYSAVLDMEMERSQTRPATLRFKLMNLTHLLSHKLYDATLAGKYEASLTPWALNQNTSTAVTGPDTNVITAVGRNGLGAAPNQFLGKDNTEGYEGGAMSNQRIPLQYFPLQTGSKIQLRVGFSNNPDKLSVVFCGEVTEIEGNEILTITAQSYLLELATASGDKLNSNSWFQLGSILHNTFDLLAPVTKGPAYGGVTIFGDNGDVASVITSMLQCSEAKHFGRWQVNSPVTPLMKGFGWKEQGAQGLGGVAALVGMDNVASALQSNYNRSGENIMVNTALTFDGTLISGNASQYRPWMDQRKYPWIPPKYYIDSQVTMSIWELIQDVSRRFPEYLLLEKWYGFPYSCDATLVYGHPFDWYRARPQMMGDTERVRALNQNNAAYKQWWASTGKQEFIGLMKDNTCPVTVYLYSSNMGTGGLENNSLTQQAGTSPEGLSASLNTLRNLAINGFDTSEGLLNNVDSIYYSVIAGKGQAITNFQRKLSAVLNSYYASILSGDQQSTDMLKPVRRYHFIDHQTIVHNGITINDKIYNAVRIGDQVKNGKSWAIRANANIPDNYVRLLDVSERINDPKENVIDQVVFGKTGIMMAYAQSFLKEELGKMYRGELVLRCVPEIEPADVLLITDPSTGMVGPIEVDTVTHIMNQEMGFITIIKPRLVVNINEDASANFLRLLMMAMGTVIPEMHRLGDLSGIARAEGAAIGVTAAGAGTALVSGLGTASTAIGGVAGVTDVIGSATLGLAGMMPASAAGAAAGSAVVSTGLAATDAVVASTAFLCGPPGWAILGLCTLAAIGAGVWWFADKTANLNPLVLCPCTKFGRPWVGGIEGWAQNDLVGYVNQRSKQFMAAEIYPLLDSWKAANGYPQTIPSTLVSNLGLSAPPHI